jgi:predicted translin family RNA/ssDNA-binding protein
MSPSLPPRARQVAALEQMRRQEQSREEHLRLSRELAEWRERMAKLWHAPVIHPQAKRTP